MPQPQGNSGAGDEGVATALSRRTCSGHPASKSARLSTHNLILVISLSALLCGCGDSNEKISDAAVHKTADHKTEVHETATQPQPTMANPDQHRLTQAEARKLSELPLHCIENEYPNKLQQTLSGDADLLPPRELHPTFYGCFDWHSAVHGYWSLVSLLQRFPELDNAEQIRALLLRNITPAKIAVELEYFSKDINKSFERTYGWAWLLKLAQSLHSWEDPLARQLETSLMPLTRQIVGKYLSFLPKLVYPIRVGEHTNTAFGLAFAHDYAVALEDEELQALIERRANDFYKQDHDCPMQWEPGGFDFLSPCLQEIDIMRRILPADDFLPWLDAFLPALREPDYRLEVAIVGDRSDGKLVHLDGVNFSRAWVLYSLANHYSQYRHLGRVANAHIAYSYPNLVGDEYEGGHWLGSFAIYALSLAAGEQAN